MHPEAHDWVARFATDEPMTAIEIGGRNVNGHIRDLFPNTTWHVIDAQDGPDVDEVANGASWLPPERVDLVVCTEVFEHSPLWREIISNIGWMLKSGGRVILTMAGPGRAPHGVNIDDPDMPGHYENIGPGPLLEAMREAGFERIVIDQQGFDVRATAIKP